MYEGYFLFVFDQQVVVRVLPAVHVLRPLHAETWNFSFVREQGVRAHCFQEEMDGAALEVLSYLQISSRNLHTIQWACTVGSSAVFTTMWEGAMGAELLFDSFLFVFCFSCCTIGTADPLEVYFSQSTLRLA